MSLNIVDPLSPFMLTCIVNLEKPFNITFSCQENCTEMISCELEIKNLKKLCQFVDFEIDDGYVKIRIENMSDSKLLSLYESLNYFKRCGNNLNVFPVSGNLRFENVTKLWQQYITTISSKFNENWIGEYLPKVLDELLNRMIKNALCIPLPSIYSDIDNCDVLVLHIDWFDIGCFGCCEKGSIYTFYSPDEKIERSYETTPEFIDAVETFFKPHASIKQ